MTVEVSITPVYKTVTHQLNVNTVFTELLNNCICHPI